MESQAYVLHCTTVLTEAGIEQMKTAGGPIMGHVIVGSSAIIAPDGRIISNAKTENEKLIVADLDLSLVTKAKTFADACGHCTSPDRANECSKNADTQIDSRPDMLWLGADDKRKQIVRHAE